MQIEKREDSKGSFVVRMLQGLIVSMIVSFLGIAAVGLYVFFFGNVFAENILKKFFVVLMLGSVFIAALLCSYIMKARGLIIGIIIGSMYAVVILFAADYFNLSSIGMSLWVKLIACAVAGGLGGVIGVNMSDDVS